MNTSVSTRRLLLTLIDVSFSGLAAVRARVLTLSLSTAARRARCGRPFG